MGIERGGEGRKGGEGGEPFVRDRQRVGGGEELKLNSSFSTTVEKILFFFCGISFLCVELESFGEGGS